jgi:hypothetical protein
MVFSRDGEEGAGSGAFTGAQTAAETRTTGTKHLKKPGTCGTILYFKIPNPAKVVLQSTGNNCGYEEN